MRRSSSIFSHAKKDSRQLAGILRGVLPRVERGASGVQGQHVVGHLPPRVLELHGRGVLGVTGVSGAVYLFWYLDECITIHYGPRAVLIGQTPH